MTPKKGQKRSEKKKLEDQTKEAKNAKKPQIFKVLRQNQRTWVGVERVS